MFNYLILTELAWSSIAVQQVIQCVLTIGRWVRVYVKIHYCVRVSQMNIHVPSCSSDHVLCSGCLLR